MIQRGSQYNGTVRLEIRKSAGKLAVVEQGLEREPLRGTCGIGHTRWATHGAPTTNNAHPHCAEGGHVALVHNGIIENYEILRAKLSELGHEFHTETDTEVLCHLIDEVFEGNLELAVAAALTRVEGAFGIAVIDGRDPDKIVIARRGSPLLIGVGEEGKRRDLRGLRRSGRAATHPPGRLPRRRRDWRYCDGTDMRSTPCPNTGRREPEPHRKGGQAVSTGTSSEIEQGGYDHFMLKEIFEQPATIQRRDAGSPAGG